MTPPTGRRARAVGIGLDGRAPVRCVFREGARRRFRRWRPLAACTCPPRGIYLYLSIYRSGVWACLGVSSRRCLYGRACTTAARHVRSSPGSTRTSETGRLQDGHDRPLTSPMISQQFCVDARHVGTVAFWCVQQGINYICKPPQKLIPGENFFKHIRTHACRKISRGSGFSEEAENDGDPNCLFFSSSSRRQQLVGLPITE